MTKSTSGNRASATNQIKCPTCPNSQNSTDIVELKIF